MIILSFCDEKTKYNFGMCSKYYLNILYCSIEQNEKEFDKCIQRNNITIFKILIKNYKNIYINTADYIIKTDKLDFFKILIEEKKELEEYKKYYFILAVKNNSLNIFNYLKDSVLLLMCAYGRLFNNHIESFELFEELFNKIVKEFSLDELLNETLDHNEENIFNFHKVITKNIPNFVPSMCEKDDILVVKIYQKNRLNLSELFKECIKYKSKKCLEHLYQNEEVQEYLTQRIQEYQDFFD